MLLAAFAPRAKADLIVYFNFEGAPTPPYAVNMMSSPLGFVSTTLVTNYTPTDTLDVMPGLPQNWQGDLPNDHALGLSRSFANTPADFDINLNTPGGFFQDMTVMFAVNGQGNGFTSVQVQFSTDGGLTFTNAGTTAIPNSGTIIVSTMLPAAANNAPLLTVRLEFLGGQSNGQNVQNVIDNITIGGTIVPEPATVAGGLFGVLGLCWFQRKRLIRSVRFGRRIPV